MGKLVQITGTRVCAVLEIDDGKVVWTEPILAHYLGLSEGRVRELVRQKHMRWEVLVGGDWGEMEPEREREHERERELEPEREREQEHQGTSGGEGSRN